MPRFGSIFGERLLPTLHSKVVYFHFLAEKGNVRPNLRIYQPWSQLEVNSTWDHIRSEAPVEPMYHFFSTDMEKRTGYSFLV